MNKIQELIKDINEEIHIFDLADELSNKTKVTNIKNILKWTIPKEWDDILKVAEVKMKRDRWMSWEDLEQFVDNNYSAKDFK